MRENTKKDLLWILIGIIVLAIVGAVIGINNRKEEKEATKEHNITLEKGKENIENGKIGTQVVAMEKCAIMKTADLKESDVKNPTYNIGSFFASDCREELKVQEELDDDAAALNYIQVTTEKINSDWEKRKNDVMKDKTLETYLLEWAAQIE